jgi:hypothetical protein
LNAAFAFPTAAWKKRLFRNKHVRAKRGYQLDEVRELLSPHVTTHASSSVEAVDADARYRPPAGWRSAHRLENDE